MTNIDPKEAAQALNDVDQIVRRVRQSRIYDLASKVMIVAGVLVVAGNIAHFIMPRYGGYIWITVNVLNVASVAALFTMGGKQVGAPQFDFSVLAAFLLFYAFGVFCSSILGHFEPREMGAFWPIYFMLFYCLTGLWFGGAFIAMGLAIIALTMIGYFFVGGFAFFLWMAAVNGGGLMLSGLWMRRV